MALTKQQARETIESGGSVLHKGRLYTKVEHLKHFDGTPEEKQSEIEDLEKRLAELKNESSGEKNGTSSSVTLDDSKEELMKHTRAQLLEEATAKGIEIGETETKAQIVEKLLAEK